MIAVKCSMLRSCFMAGLLYVILDHYLRIVYAKLGPLLEQYFYSSNTTIYCTPTSDLDMTSVVSLQSLILDIPPSCIEFCPAAPQYFVVGTYFLEKKEQNVSHPESEVDEVPKEDQKRTGSLILFRLIGEEV